ncbi:phage holin family protein [Clostridium sp. OS1-26]|uniref:phage holin family protein n=1 Tax=Clostridium sp. OS1-26 TaxID=3070681 RepID=UPI0035A94B15
MSLTYLFSRWDTCLVVLVIFMALDYVTRFISAWIKNRINSKTFILQQSLVSLQNKNHSNKAYL